MEEGRTYSEQDHRGGLESGAWSVAMISGASGASGISSNSSAAGASSATAVGAAAGAPLPALEWKFSQVFGERAIGEEVQEGIHVAGSVV